MRRYALRDEQWERIKDLLPGRAGQAGVTAKDNRLSVAAALYRCRAGIPWRDLPERYGPWQTVYSRFRRWQQAGVWDRVLAALQAEGDAAGDLDWSLHFVDGSTVRAHQHAAGAKKGAAIRRSAARGAAFRPRSTSGPSAAANRSPAC